MGDAILAVLSCCTVLQTALTMTSSSQQSAALQQWVLVYNILLIAYLVIITTADNCDTCLCTNTPRGLLVDCQNQNLQYVNSIPDGAVTLDLSWNNFPQINYFMFPLSDLDVKYLIIEHSNVREVENQAFDRFTKLHQVKPVS